jgi:hypothetical protein
MQATGFNRERAIRLYFWNAAVGQSFHFPIQTLEISLRNCISSVFHTVHGDNWFQEKTAFRLLGKRAADEIRTAGTRLQKRGVVASTDDIIASLSFGFWAACLAPRHKPGIWSRHLGAAFPHKPDSITQDVIYTGINDTLHLRNRIFHHEPLIGLDLSARYAGILNILSWICPATHKWVRSNSTVPTALRAKP